MSTLLKRAHRVLLFVVAGVFGLSLLAPIATLANSDLVPGDQAVIDNPDGSGANLRSDVAVLDDSTLITEVTQGTTVSLIEGPIVADSGTWFRVAVPGIAEGFVSSSLLLPFEADAATSDTEADIAIEAAVSDEVATEVTTSPDLLRQEPIDVGFVADDNHEIPAEGLACRATPTIDGEILARIPVNASLEVVGPRIWQGDINFLHVNCADGAGYVNGAYVVLESEGVPALNESVTADEAVTEDAALEAPVVEEPVVEIPAVEIPAIEVPAVEIPAVEVPAVEVPGVEVPDIEIPAIDIPAVEVPAVEIPAVEVPAAVDEPVTADEAVTEDAALEAPVVEEPVVEIPAVEIPAIEVPAVEIPAVDTATVPESPDAEVSAAAIVDEPIPAVEAPVAPEVPEIPVVDAPNIPEAPGIPVVDELEVEDETVSDTTTEDQALDDRSEETSNVVTDEVVEVPEIDEDPAAITAEASTTDEPAVATTAAVPAVTVAASDTSTAIGSATVTGTNSEGLRCRVAPSDDAATLMVLDEGTKVYVLSEPTNGYLGIDCGGLQGFADVNLLWSGGAGDGQIQGPSMSLAVSGTGSGLNCRTGAGTSFPVITVLPDGTTLTTRAAASNGWVAVVCGGQNGFVATPYVQVSSGSAATPSTGTGSPSTGTGTATVSNTGGEGLRCRSGAGTTYSIITVLAPGTKVTVRGANQGEWTPVSCGGTNGWVHSSFLTMGSGSGTAKPAPAPSTGAVTGTATVTTGGDGLYCRSGAGSTYSVITILANGQSVPVRGSTSNGWVPVTCGGSAGWASAQYLTVGSGSTAPTNLAPAPAPTSAPSGMSSGDHAKTTANLNLRYSASLGAGVAAVAPTGTVVLITGGPSNGFYSVDWNGLKGFMSSDYLAKTSEPLSQRGGSASPGAAPAPTTSSTATGNAMVDYAMRYLGYPYVWATHGPASFDCSGFTYWVAMNVLGKNIGYGTWTQVAAGTPVSRSNLQPGDLVFFQNTYTAGLSHVGIYIGNNQFIHAQNESTGVVISDLNSSYYGPRWYGAVRL